MRQTKNKKGKDGHTKLTTEEREVLQQTDENCKIILINNLEIFKKIPKKIHC